MHDAGALRQVEGSWQDSMHRTIASHSTRMAGPGELVYYEGGREAALSLDPWFVAVDHAIIGIVDDVVREPR